MPTARQTRTMELRCAVPPYASSTLVRDSHLPHAKSLWLGMIAAEASFDGPRLQRWIAAILEMRDPMALFLTVDHNPAALDIVLATAGVHTLQRQLESCPLWVAIVGFLRTPTSAHQRVALLSRFPTGDTLARFVDTAYPLLVGEGPAPWSKAMDGDTDWMVCENVWRERLGLPDMPRDKRARQAILQAQRGRTKGPIGGDDSRRPTKAQP